MLLLLLFNKDDDVDDIEEEDDDEDELDAAVINRPFNTISCFNFLNAPS